jgi:hypothetical protein
VRLTFEGGRDLRAAGQLLAGTRPSFLRLVFKDSTRIMRFFDPRSPLLCPKAAQL